jgi:signal transduction histidine kinase
MLNELHEKDLISAIIYTMIGFMLMAGVLLAFFYFSKKKIMRKEIEKKDMELQHQKELLRSTIMTQEQERKRIAQDLHDDISSKLNIVSLNTHLLTTPGISASEQQSLTANIINLTAKALENSRRIAHDLLPPVLEKFGLQAAVEELVQEVSSSRKVTINFSNNLEFNIVDEVVHLHVFRILQELMNNSLRHGKATMIKIAFTRSNGNNTCLYTDNGQGMDLTNPALQRGLGMQNIYSRVEILSGEITFDSSPGRGVHVTFTF